MTSGTISSLLLAFLSCAQVLAQSQQVQYNQVLNVNGDMKLNSFVFPDRSKVETFSQKQQQIIVNQQTPSIPANQVTGSTGQPFVAVSPQSMTISTNGATDLVGGQIEMAMTMQNLQGVAVQPDNAYVAMLSPDRQTWIIQETMRTVNTTDMTVRMVKRSQMDGEYMVVGRQTVETNTLVVPFGSDGSTSVGIQGTGLQENEFQDGFRMSTRATQPMTMNVDVKKGVDQGMLSALQGQSTVNDYRYSVITNLAAVTPNLNQQVTVIQMPVNAVRLQKMMQAMGVPPTGSVAIGVAQRSVLMNPGGATGSLGGAATRRGLTRDEFRKEVARQVQGGTGTINNNPVATQLLLAPTFTPIQAEAVLDQANMRIAIPVRQIDGEYILTMKIMTGSQANAEPAAPAASPAPAAASPATAAAASPAPAAAAAAPPAAASPATEAAAPAAASPAAAPPAAASPAAEAPAAAASPATASPAAAAPAAAAPAAASPEAASPAAEGAKPAEASAAAPAVASGAAPAATEAAAKASQPTAPAAAGTEAAAKASLPTAAAAPAATAAAAKPETPAAVESPKGNSTEPAKPEAAKPEESKPAAAAKPERRADAGTDKYGLPKAPLGSVIMTMKEIDTMADMMTWGGQVAITKMMNDFVQVSTGASASTASSKDGTAKIAL